MIPTLILNESRIVARLDAIGPSVRQKLIEVLTPLAEEVVADAKSRAQAHIRYLGLKPGEYLDSIKGGVSLKNDKRVTGYIRSGSPIAHLLEYGANVPAHEILPKIAKVLAFTGSAGTVFAKAVHSPGATIPPYPALGPAFEARKSEIKAALIEAGREGMKAEA